MPANRAKPARDTAPYIVSTPDDLRRAARTGGNLLIRPPVMLLIPGIDPGDRARWQKEINHLSGECGCKTGALAICLAEIGYFIGLGAGWLTLSGWAAVGAGFAVAFASGIVGKAIGILRAELSRKRVVGELIATLERPGTGDIG